MSPRYFLFKSFIDRFTALLIVFLLAPVLVFVSLLVRFSLGSPVLFIQQRPGYKGRPFKLIKFRTMKNSRDASGVLLPDDLRLTRLGNFLRSTSLDELPELLNILMGDMSFIGPRPLLMQYLPLYTDEQFRRHDVKPGLSGLAQVKGRNSLSWHDKFRFDVQYVDNCNFFLDIRIFVSTAWFVLLRKGVTPPGEVMTQPFSPTDSLSN